MNPNPVVILGVTGSIAAHKAVDIASQLTKKECAVRVVMTPDAQRFITAQPFKTLTRHKVVTELFDNQEDWEPVHIEWADAAQLMLVAPASANTIAKLAHGIADNALTCMALALNTDARLLIAPAMNGKMWNHPATQQNVGILRERGAQFIGPEEGILACGYVGAGRLWPVESIVDQALKLLHKSS